METSKDRRLRKILLISPPRLMYSRDEHKRSAPPLGLAYLAAVLEDKYEVKILDAVAEGFWNTSEEEGGLLNYGLSFNEIRRRVIEYAPDIVGVSSIFSSQHPNAVRTTALIKSIDKDIITVMGGDHPTALPGEVLLEKNLDFAILGEGEYSFLELIRSLERGRGWEEIDGISYLEGDIVKINPKKKYIKDLDELPFPARHLLPMELYQKINAPHSEPVPNDRLPYTPMISSRGCPAACTFCSSAMMWGKHNLRNRSAENVLKELEHLLSQGYKEVYFDDDNFIYDHERANKILDTIIERKWDLTWSMPNGVALYSLNKPLMEKMKKAGCHTLCLPIESGSQKTLSKIIHKPLSLKKVPGLIKDMKELGFYTMGFFMIGFPGETQAEIEQTIKYAMEMKELGMDYGSFFIVIPLPGTEIYKTCLNYGYIDDLVLTKMMTGKGLIKTPEFDPEYLGQLRHKAWVTLNFATNTDFILYPEEIDNLSSKLKAFNVIDKNGVVVAGDLPELVSLLEKEDYKCNIVENMDELSARLDNAAVSLLIIERTLTFIDTWEFLKAFRKDKRHGGVPVLLVVKEEKDKIKGHDIIWFILEVLDKKGQYI